MFTWLVPVELPALAFEGIAGGFIIKTSNLNYNI